jgi:hypothetical protein
MRHDAKREVIMTENDVKAYLKERLNTLPKCFHFPASAGAFSIGGVSDRLACVRGRFVAIEAKRPGRRGEKNEGLSGLQVRLGKLVTAAGGSFFKVDDQESVDEVVKELRWY